MTVLGKFGPSTFVIPVSSIATTHTKWCTEILPVCAKTKNSKHDKNLLDESPA
jgi:hypothetical protein